MFKMNTLRDSYIQLFRLMYNDFELTETGPCKSTATTKYK